MKRRNFLAAAGLSSAYSLYVDASQLPPSTHTPSGAELHGIFQRPEFERIAPPRSLAKASAAEPNLTAVDLKTDVLVAGGGLAGVLAAVSAARHGAKVILVQDRSRLGGNSSSEVKMHVVGASSHKGRPGWREGGLLEEMRLDDAVNNPHRAWEMWDILLYDKVISEPNITLLLETTLVRAAVKDGKITEVLARCDKSEHLYRIEAKLFCDCTGDSRLGLEAGAEMRSGREARSEFQEALAPEKADGETLGSSILFTSRLYPRPVPFKAPAWARKVTKEHLKLRSTAAWEYGYWWIEWGGNRDTIRDNELIRFELLSIVMGVWDYIKNSGEHRDSDYYGLDWVGMMPGKRGSRRLVGDYMLKQDDLANSVHFPDAVAIGGWPMDDHPPGGFDRADLPPAVAVRTKEVYSIPLRSLYSKNISNLFMAGRNISATHVAFTSTRVMATCAVEGQAIGTAAALCLQHDMTPRQLAQDAKRVKALQQRLLRDDQSLVGVKNEDPADLARKAKPTASHAAPDTPASNLLTGETRDIPKGARHQWSAPLEPNGKTWVALEWEAPQSLSQLQITFDSGFQRELTLTSSNAINRGILRGPQPETVKAYRLEYRATAAGDWQPLLEEKDNHQRLARHKLASSVRAQAIRLIVDATHGDDHARVFEIRCYA